MKFSQNNLHIQVRSNHRRMKAAALSVLMLMFLTAAAEKETLKLCGRRLANARVALCFGESYLAKRSGMEKFLATIVPDEPERRWRRGALSGRWSRLKRLELGLVDKCCINSCTIDEIKSYC